MPSDRTGVTISVRVKLFADLRRYLPPGLDASLPVTLPAGATVGEAMVAVGIPEGEQVIAGLRGEQAYPDSPLRDGDELLLFSPMEGGCGGAMPSARSEYRVPRGEGPATTV